VGQTRLGRGDAGGDDGPSPVGDRRPPRGEVCAPVRVSDLRLRDVVNILDGRRLGVVSDVEVDLGSGRIVAIVVPGPGRFLGIFGREADYVIPWERIRKIGSDVILVELPAYADPFPRG